MDIVKMQQEFYGRQARQAFDEAIKEGFLSGTDPDSPTYAGKWMYMDTLPDSNGQLVDSFKNITTRKYISRVVSVKAV